MLKLLHADFSRLFKSRVFILFVALIFVIGAALPTIHYIDEKNNDTPWSIDSSFFIYVFFVPILTAILTALFVGSEYSDGTMRNKIIVGHKRYNVYLSNLIVCTTAGILLCIAYIASHICVGIPLLGSFESGFGTIMTYTGLSLALIMASASIFTLISMLCCNKAYSVAICIILSFALLFAGIRILSALNEPEYFGAYSYTENGRTIEEEAEKNPHYLNGTKRDVYEFMYDFVPGGQTLQISNMKAEHSGHLAIYDSLIFVVTTGCGVFVFRRKELK